MREFYERFWPEVKSPRPDRLENAVRRDGALFCGFLADNWRL
jgi:hypothetical protein